MKATIKYKIVLLSLCLAGLFTSQTVGAQIQFRVKAGLNTQNVGPDQLLITSSERINDFTLTLEKAHYGFHFGFEAKIKLANFFIKPEVLFSSNEVDYTFEEVNDVGVVSNVLSESYNYIDLPLSVGTGLGPLSFFVGPVGHIFVNSTSDLLDIDGYDQVFSNITYGWNVGTGLALGRLSVDLRYEGNFTRFGDHFRFFGQELSPLRKHTKLKLFLFAIFSLFLIR